MTTGAGHPAAKPPDRWRRRARVAAWFLIAALAVQIIAMLVSVQCPRTLLAESASTGGTAYLDFTLAYGVAGANLVRFREFELRNRKPQWQFEVSPNPVGKPATWNQLIGLMWPIISPFPRGGTVLNSNWFIVLPLWCLMLPTAILALLLMRAGRRRSPPGFCPVCRYDLTANTSGICPECGSPIEPAQTAAPRGS